MRSHRKSTPWIPSRTLSLAALALLLAGAGFDGAAWAQVCSNTPGSNERVECREFAGSSEDIDLDLRGVSIETNQQSGIWGEHGGSGNITINLRDSSVETAGGSARGIASWQIGATGNTRITVQRSSITTEGNDSTSLYSLHSAAGNLDIRVEDSSVETEGQRAHGVYGAKQGTGNLGIHVKSSSVTTAEQLANGLYGLHSGTGNLNVHAEGGSVTTQGEQAHGIVGWHYGATGNTRITTQSSSITTTGRLSHGLFIPHSAAGDLDVHVEGGSISTTGQSAQGVYGWHGTTGNLDIHVEGGSIKTSGEQARGIVGWHWGTAGNARITAQSSSITTTGPDSHGVFGRHGTTGDLGVHVEGGLISTADKESHGIVGWHRGDTGNTRITAQSSSITTAGQNAYGLYGQHSSAGDLNVHVEGGSITTSGEQAHGIFGWHGGATGNLDINVAADSSIRTTGASAHGIYGFHGTGKGRISIDVGPDASVHASGTDASGVRVGGFDAVAGALGGMAKMGPDGYRQQTVTVNGTVTGGSGDAAGVLLADGGKVFVGPQGYVSADSGVAVRAYGCSPLYVNIELGERLMKEAVDGVILNDGRTDLVVNGVLLRDGTTGSTGRWGVNGPWDVAWRELKRDPSQGTAPADPCTGTMAGATTNPAGEFAEVYAPRAVLYESLPGLLLRLDEGPPRRRPETPAWTQVEHAVGHGEPARSQTGARYDYDRTEMLAGMSRAWRGGMSGSLWLRGVRVAAETEVVSGRGELDVRGVGAGLEARWRGEDGLELSGQLSLTDYDVDASSRRHGRLLREVGARALEASLAGGRRVELGPGATLLPRAWLRHAEVEVDDFTDAVGVQASFADEPRTSGGLGLAAEWEGPEHSLYGSLDLERLLGGEATAVEISGRRFSASAERTRAWLGFGGESRGKWLTLRGGVRLGDPGGRNEEFAAWFSLAGRF